MHNFSYFLSARVCRRASTLKSPSPSDAAPQRRATCSNRFPRNRSRISVLKATSRRSSSIGSWSGIGRGPAVHLCLSTCRSAALARPSRPPGRPHCRSSACAAPILARAAATTCMRRRCASSRAGAGRLPLLLALLRVGQCGGGLARRLRSFGWMVPHTRQHGRRPTGHSPTSTSRARRPLGCRSACRGCLERRPSRSGSFRLPPCRLVGRHGCHEPEGPSSARVDVLP